MIYCICGKNHLLFLPRQTLLAMKLTIIMTLIAFHVSAGGYTQVVTLHKKDAPLTDIFKDIRQQTGYDFFYELSWLEKAKPVNINVNNIPLTDALNLCFKDQPLAYIITGTTIVLKLKPAQPTTFVAPADFDIQGLVLDDNSAPLPGVNVIVKGTDKITNTNIRGEFRIKNIQINTVLVVSSVGYHRQEVAVASQNNLRIQLRTAIGTLDEIQFVAYGTTSKRLNTGNVGSLKASDIEKQPVQNPLLALQGRLAGVAVTQTNGVAGGAVKIRIQGQNSIGNDADPLYVVDGVPIDAQLPRTGLDFVLASAGPKGGGGWGNPLSYINPADIESIEVLKDADATAIYGSRAASGAILITTKKGKSDKNGIMRFDLNMQAGVGNMTRRVKMLNTRQYLDMRYEAFANDGIDWTSPLISANDLKVWDTTRYTNWQNELLGGTAKYTNISASVSGGTNISRYLISGTYHKETTVLPLSDDFANKKGAVHFNVDANSANNAFKLQFSGNFMADNNQLPQNDITQYALLLEPNAPALLNEDGSINWAPDASGNTTLSDANVMLNRYLKYVNKTYNLVSSLMLRYTVLPGLEVRSSMGFNYMQTNDFSPAPLITVAPELRAATLRSAAFGNRNIKSWIVEPQASYSTIIAKGKLELLVGSTFQDKNANSGYIYGSGQLSDELLDDIQAASNVYTGVSASSRYKYNALFGRVNYNWSDKYIVNVNFRRDGSTRFGAHNRFHNFGSIGGAWIFSNEKFIQDKAGFISFGKLRGSFGTTGNDQIGDYRFMSLYNLYSNAPAAYQGAIGLVPAGLPNPDLQWEETQKLQVGLDLGFWQERLVINATWVNNRSSNQLLSYSLPNITGFAGYITNFPATLQNRNWELTVTGKISSNKRVSWTSSANLTLPQNKLIRFPGLSASTYASTLIIGEPIDVVKYFHYTSVAPGTGDYLYSGQNGYPTLAPDPSTDRTILISRFPKLYGGFQNNLTYKGIQLDVLFQFVKQIGYNDVAFWNGSRYPGMFARGVSNQPVTVLDRWRKIGDNATVARFRTTEISDIISSDHRFADASFIRLKNVALSWGLPQKWMDKAHFRSCRMYLHAQNLLTITKYKGLDPEGQGMATLPPLRVLTIGIQAGF